MARCMEHWNGDMVCCIDCETTGLDPLYNEIVQLAIVPLDSNFDIREDVLPLNILIKPDNPHCIDIKAMSCNKLDVNHIMKVGLDREAAKDILREWYDELGLTFTKWDRQKRIIPLGQNYAFDMAFMKRWLGIEMYEELFHHSYRDTMTAALYLNDRAGMHAEVVPYSKTNLTWLASKYNIEYRRKHDALSDCVVTAATYKKMVQQGLIG